MKRAAFLAGLAVTLLAVLGPQPSKAAVVGAGLSADVAALGTDLQALAKQKFKGGGGKGNAKGNRGGGGKQNANRNNNNRQSNKNFKNNNNRNKNVNVRVNVRPVRGWVRRPYYGTVVGGVALGAIIAASTIPVAPAPGLCWYWTDATQSNGYWDYCN